MHICVCVCVCVCAGVEFQHIPDTGDVPLVVDMSSNILTRELDISRVCRRVCVCVCVCVCMLLCVFFCLYLSVFTTPCKCTNI